MGKALLYRQGLLFSLSSSTLPKDIKQAVAISQTFCSKHVDVSSLISRSLMPFSTVMVCGGVCPHYTEYNIPQSAVDYTYTRFYSNADKHNNLHGEKMALRLLGIKANNVHSCRHCSMWTACPTCCSVQMRSSYVTLDHCVVSMKPAKLVR